MTGDDDIRLRFNPKKRKLIKSLVARNAEGKAQQLDLEGEWRLDNDLGPWRLHAEITLPIRFGFSVVSVELDVPRNVKNAGVSVGLYPPRMFFVE